MRHSDFVCDLRNWIAICICFCFVRIQLSHPRQLHHVYLLIFGFGFGFPFQVVLVSTNGVYSNPKRKAWTGMSKSETNVQMHFVMVLRLRQNVHRLGGISIKNNRINSLLRYHFEFRSRDLHTCISNEPFYFDTVEFIGESCTNWYYSSFQMQCCNMHPKRYRFHLNVFGIRSNACRFI